MSENVKHVPLDDMLTFAGRCRHLYYIKGKDKQTVPFIFSEAQEILNEIVEEEFRRTKRENGASQGRFIVLKPRQIGATTYFGVKAFDKLLNDHGTDVLTMAHNTDTTRLIYEIYRRCYDNLPDVVIPTIHGNPITQLTYLKEVYPDRVKNLSAEERSQLSSVQCRIKVKPETKAYSGNQMSFVDNDSRSIIQTAGSKDDAGKGITPSIVHKSECANFPDYHSTMTSVMPSVPKDTDGVLVALESTANGVSGKGEGYYNTWTNSSTACNDYRNGKDPSFSGFRPIFVPWYMIKEYSKPLAGGRLESIENIDFGSEDRKREFLEKEDMMRKGIYNPLTGEKVVLTEEQINWYRWIIKTDCEYDYNLAMRYYPTTPEEAFTASSFGFFDAQKLSNLKTKRLNKPLPFKRGTIDWGEGGELEFNEDSLGGWKIFEQPDPEWENRYILGCLPEGETVLTDSGLKEVENVDFGDKLVNKEGDNVDIINTQKRYYEGNIYGIETKNNYRRTYFTSEHPIFASSNSKLKRKYKGRRFWEHDFDFHRADQLSVGDWVKYPNIYRKNILSDDDILNKWKTLDDSIRYDFHIDNPVLDEEFWRFIGLWLGDGWTQERGYLKSVHVCFDKKEKHLQSRALKFLNKIDRSTHIVEKESTIEYLLTSKQLHLFLENNFGKYAHNKKIPDWVKRLPDRFKTKFVEGYMDADGSIFEESRSKGRGRISFVSVSLELLEGIQDIMFSIGFIGSLNKLRNENNNGRISGVKCKQRKCYQLSYGFYDTVEFLNKIGREHNYTYKYRRIIKDSYFSKDLDYIYFRISNITKEEYKGYVYNFECDTHTYLSRGIPTHNCDVGRGYEDGDYSVAVILDRLTERFVGYYHDKIDQDLFAEELIKGGTFYNEAYFVVESNLDTVVSLINPDGMIPYIGEMYHHQQGNNIRWGYLTHGGSRNPLLNFYKAFLRGEEGGEDRYEALPDTAMIDEHLTFVRKAPTRVGGMVKYEADEGQHDDFVIAAALANIGYRAWDATLQKTEDKSKVLNILSKPFRRKRRMRQSSLGRR